MLVLSNTVMILLNDFESFVNDWGSDKTVIIRQKLLYSLRSSMAWMRREGSADFLRTVSIARNRMRTGAVKSRLVV